jgi:hypothetical protein
MKKAVILLALLLPVAALVLVSCGSAPAATPKGLPAAKETAIELIDDQFHEKKYPEWVKMMAMPSDIEESDDILKSDKGKVYVFVTTQRGKSLDGVETWAKNFSMASDIASVVSTRVQSSFAGAAAGDKDKLDSYMEQVVKTMSSASYSGAKRKASYWAKIRETDPKGAVSDYFEYYLLVTIPKDVLDAQIKKALDGADGAVKPKTEEEKVARERVKKALETEGL